MNDSVKSGLRGLFAALTLLSMLAGCASQGRPGAAASVSAPAAERASETSLTSLTGTVSSRTEAKGTLSEYTLYYLDTGSGSPVILFNAKGYSSGFADWEGIRVKVTGESLEGRVGNGNKRAKGFRADTIEALP